MAMQFTLTPRHDPEHGPMFLEHIDIGIAKFIGEPLSNERWCLGWYDNIGYWLACGYTFQQIRNQLMSYIMLDNLRTDEFGKKQALLAVKNLAILEFIDTNYIVNAWYSH